MSDDDKTTEFVGSGCTINIYGVTDSDPITLADAASWAVPRAARVEVKPTGRRFAWLRRLLRHKP